MKNLKSLLIVALVATMAIFGGCKKGDKGDTGPAGTNGTNGTDGNANVSVYNKSVTTSQWSDDGNGGWYAGFTTVGFDATKGAVSAFWSNDNSTWGALPWVGYTIGAPDINYVFNSSSIYIYYDAQTGVASISKPTSTLYFKFVIIPPARKIPNVNYSDYNSLASAYNLTN